MHRKGEHALVRGVVVELLRVGLAEQLDVRTAALRGLGVLEGVLDDKIGALVGEGVGLGGEEVVAHVLSGHDALGRGLLTAVVVAGGVLPRTERLVAGGASLPAALPVIAEGPAEQRQGISRQPSTTAARPSSTVCTRVNPTPPPIQTRKAGHSLLVQGLGRGGGDERRGNEKLHHRDAEDVDVLVAAGVLSVR